MEVRWGLSQGGTGLALWDWEMIILVAFSVPDEPIQPIDPAAWVSHSAALTGTFPAYPGSSSMSTITSGSSLPDGEPQACLIPPSLENSSLQWCDSATPWRWALPLISHCLLCQAVRAGVSPSTQTWHL